MVERNEKGKLARLYFIEMEKRAQGMLLESQAPLELEGSDKSIREQAKDKQRELMSMIRKYLKHGDIAYVASKIGKRADTVKDILNCHWHNKEITQALYQRALENKRGILIYYNAMIDELKK